MKTVYTCFWVFRVTLRRTNHRRSQGFRSPAISRITTTLSYSFLFLLLSLLMLRLRFQLQIEQFLIEGNASREFWWFCRSFTHGLLELKALLDPRKRRSSAVGSHDIFGLFEAIMRRYRYSLWQFQRLERSSQRVGFKVERRFWLSKNVKNQVDIFTYTDTYAVGPATENLLPLLGSKGLVVASEVVDVVTLSSFTGSVAATFSTVS